MHCHHKTCMSISPSFGALSGHNGFKQLEDITGRHCIANGNRCVHRSQHSFTSGKTWCLLFQKCLFKISTAPHYQTLAAATALTEAGGVSLTEWTNEVKCWFSSLFLLNNRESKELPREKTLTILYLDVWIVNIYRNSSNCYDNIDLKLWFSSYV